MIACTVPSLLSIITDVNPASLNAASNMLRDPTRLGGTLTNILQKKLIPTVAHLRQHLPIQLVTMFTPPLLNLCQIPETIHCGNLVHSDRYLSRFENK